MNWFKSMKKVLILIFLLPLLSVMAQKIGKTAPDPPPMEFPSNAWGVDLMFGDGGFGLGTFYRKSLNTSLTLFADFSISESKDDKEVEYVDYFGNIIVIGKVNRVFLLPLTFGFHFRLFEKQLTENLRPYLQIGVGPNFILSTPYEQEFFEAFGDARFQTAAGGYVGIGANFGLSKENLMGINLRYHYTHLFGAGIENLEGRSRTDFGDIFLSLSIGLMY